MGLSFAALLDGVPRHSGYDIVWQQDGHPGQPTPDGKWVSYDEVLAALAAAYPADLAEAGKVLEGVTPGRVVQFHPSFCKEAEGSPFSEWDSSHDLSVIQPDGKRYRIGSMRHANDAAFFQWCREGVPALLARIAAQEAQMTTILNEREGLRLAMEKWVEESETALAAERAKVAKLVEALKPFSFADSEYDDIPDIQGVTLIKSDNGENLNLVFMSDLRRARAAITEAGK